MNNDSRSLIILAIILILVYILYTLYSSTNCCSSEGFWGGYMPVPYMNQPLTKYGRSGIDAATDSPKMLIDPASCPINPTFCERCQGYRCCCR